MRSSDPDRRPRARQVLAASAVWTVCLLAGCARAGGATDAVARPNQTSKADCSPTSAAQTELRTTVESSPLYTMLASSGNLQSCRFSETSGRLVGDYIFASGSVLHVERTPAIEFSLQEVRFAAPVSIDARAVLMRAEQAAFGAEGCDMDWQKPESDATNAQGQRETVYRGGTCNCQARVRSTSPGTVVGLIFRSAC
jgi:hypothetical protein